MANFTLANVTDFVGLFRHINSELTSGMFGIFLLFGLFAIMFMAMIRFGPLRAFASSMYVVTIVSIFLSIMQIVTPEAILGCTILTALGTFLLFTLDRD